MNTDMCSTSIESHVAWKGCVSAWRCFMPLLFNATNYFLSPVFVKLKEGVAKLLLTLTATRGSEDWFGCIKNTHCTVCHCAVHNGIERRDKKSGVMIAKRYGGAVKGLGHHM